MSSLIYTISHNGKSERYYTTGNVVLKNGSVTKTITSAETVNLHCKDMAPANNLVIGSKLLNCKGEAMAGNVSVVTVQGPVLSNLFYGNYATEQVYLAWTLGSGTDGVYVYAQGTSLLYKGAGSAIQVSTTESYATGYIAYADSGIPCTFSVVPYRVYDGVEYRGESETAIIVPQTFSGRYTFESTGTWTVPEGVRNISVFCTGGGAGSGGLYANQNSNQLFGFGGAGAGAYTTTVNNIAVIPGQVVTANIGAGGIGGVDYDGYSGSPPSTDGSPGGQTTVYVAGTLKASVTSVAGGGTRGTSTTYGGNGGTGGSGGAGSGNGNMYGTRTGTGAKCGYGGWNGSNGNNGGYSTGGTGDGKNKYAFGSSSDILTCNGGDGDGDGDWIGTAPPRSSGYGDGADGGFAENGSSGVAIVKW